MVNKFGIGIGGRNVKRSTLNVQRPAFTLMELLVSIGIFGFITTAVVANFRASQFSGELRLAAAELAQKISVVRSMAQTGVATPLCGDDAGEDAQKVCEVGTGVTCASCAARIPRGGYGVRIENGAVTFFADNLGLSEDGATTNHAYDEGEALVSVRAELPERVQVSSEATPLIITFVPPQGEIWINEAQATDEARIMLQHTQTGVTREVIVRRISGRVEIE